MSDTQDNNQLQAQLAHYNQLAQALQHSQNMPEVEAALSPIISLPEEEQVSLLKGLAAAHSVAIANVIQAVQLISASKDVRKEARRALVKLENADVYPTWTPPPSPTLTQTMEEISDSDALLSELQSLMSSARGILAEYDYAQTVTDFIEAWAEQNFAEAYELLASNSPLREELSQDAWEARRRAWSEQTHPEDEVVTFVHEYTEEDEAQVPRVEIGWSLEFNTATTTSTLPELPTATIIFQETGRHWFWSSYSLVQEDGEWRIHSMRDEGTRVLQLPASELQQRIATIIDLANQRLEEDEALEDIDEEDEEQDEPIIVSAVASDDEDEDEDDEDEDDEDDLDEDDLIEGEAFEETLQQMDEAIRLTTQAMHYNDALIAQSPADNPDVYKQAYAQAMAVNEAERAAVYLQKLAEQFPEQRALALQELALTLNTLIDEYIEMEDEDKATQFRALTEKTLHDAIAADQNAPAAYIMLADLLIEDDDKLDEAEALLNHAQPLTTNPQEVTLVEAGLAEIAHIREEPEKALVHYLKVAELAPDFPDIWFNIGSLHNQLQQYDEAIHYLQLSIKTAPAQAGAYAELGAIYAQRDELGKARTILKEGLDLNPDTVELLAMLALTYVQSNDLTTARRYLEQAEDTDEENELVQTVRAVYNDKKASQRSAQKPKFKQHKKKK